MKKKLKFKYKYFYYINEASYYKELANENIRNRNILFEENFNLKEEVEYLKQKLSKQPRKQQTQTKIF